MNLTKLGFTKRDDLKSYWKNFKDITSHKVDIYRAGRELDLPRRQLLRHDLSKYRPSEFFPYAKWLHHPSGRSGEKDPEVYQRFRKAVDLHYSRNPHHWRRQGVPDEEKRKVILKKGLTDWYAAAKREGYPGTFSEWYSTNRDRLDLRPDVKRRADEYLLKGAGLIAQMKSQLFKGMKLKKPSAKKSLKSSTKKGLTRSAIYGKEINI